MTAARTGNPRAVRVLIDRGADVNAGIRLGETALMWAASENHADVVTLLRAHGADVNARSNHDYFPKDGSASKACSRFFRAATGRR